MVHRTWEKKNRLEKSEAVTFSQVPVISDKAVMESCAQTSPSPFICSRALKSGTHSHRLRPEITYYSKSLRELAADTLQRLLSTIAHIEAVAENFK